MNTDHKSDTNRSTGVILLRLCLRPWTISRCTALYAHIPIRSDAAGTDDSGPVVTEIPCNVNRYKTLETSTC